MSSGNSISRVIDTASRAVDARISWPHSAIGRKGRGDRTTIVCAIAVSVGGCV